MGGLDYLFIVPVGICDARILLGVPLGFYPKGSFYIPPGTMITPPKVSFSIINLIIDVLFWYIVSAGTVSLWRKIIRKVLSNKAIRRT